MTKTEFRQYLYNNYHVPGDNCTMAPDMLDGILEWSENMDPEMQLSFYKTVFPAIPERILKTVD